MKHLKIFETTAEYNAFKLTDNFATPNISLCEDAPTVMHYEPYVAPVAPVATHEWVEIGGIKWATMNVGANSITDTGLYFQWGDTQGYTAAQVGEGEGQKYFGWNDYIFKGGEDPESDFTKYNSEDNLITLQPADDAVTAAWGGNWRTPTASEFIVLGEAVETAWTDDYQGSGIAGLICTDKTDETKTLFFPACGDIYDGEVYSINQNGRYWSSIINAECPDYGSYHLYFYKYDTTWNEIYGHRMNGFTVRGILDDSNS